MQTPYKPVYFQKTTRKFRYIIIHDLSCRFSQLATAKEDSKKTSISALRSYNWIFNDELDVPYHFICERVGRDYETLMGTPFCYKCIYDDIPSEFEASIHIAFGADFHVIQPRPRLYQQMGYKPIASVMRWFGIPFGHIYTHNEISTNKELECPGPNFDKSKFLSVIKPMVLMKG